MIVLGLILFAVAVAAAIVFVTQNSSELVTVHALGNSWSIHIYWVVALGVAIAALAIVGVALMMSGSERTLRLRQERKALSAENERLYDEISAGRDREAVLTDHVMAEPNAPIPVEERRDRGQLFRRTSHRAV